MHIQSTHKPKSVSTSKFERTAKAETPQSAPKESMTFGFHRDPDIYVKAATAVVGGALAGSYASGGWAIPANIGINAGLGLVVGAGYEMTQGGGMLSGAMLISEPIAGIGSGAVGGLVGYGLSAATGISPAITCAVAGGAFALLAYR